MPKRSWLKACWNCSEACGRGVLGLVRWLSWIALTLLAGLQIFILASQELKVPEFLLRNVETRLAAAGLHVRFGDFTLDPTGNLLVHDVRLGLVSSDTAVMSAKSISLQLDPVALWLKRVEPSEIRFNDVNLLIPPTLSPSGEAEAWVAGINTALVRGEKEGLIELNHFTAQTGGIAISAFGRFTLPTKETGEALPLDLMIRTFTQNYLHCCEVVGNILPDLPSMQDAKLELELTPDPKRGASLTARLQATHLEFPLPLEPTRQLVFENIALSSEFKSNAATAHPVLIEAARLEISGLADVLNPRLELTTDWDIGSRYFAADELNFSANGLNLADLQISAITAKARLKGAPVVQTEATLRIGETGWDLATDLDLNEQAGRVSVAGELDPKLLEIVAEKINFDVPSILDWETKPYLEVTVVLGPGGKPLRAEANFSTGPVVARWVPLDATAAHVVWADNFLRADQILLRTGDSAASGNYEMDTTDWRFRFLLDGQLMPSDINGWFRDWWPRFFSSFDFKTAPPAANVEISGQWGLPLDTRVFISADASDVAVKDIEMNRMRTRLFVRPGWVDVSHFLAERTPGDIEGTFTRKWRLPDGRRWTSLTVDARGRSDLSPVPKLLRATGEQIVEPFTFDSPLDLELTGSISREDLGAPTTEKFRVSGSTKGKWSFKDFPLRDLDFTAVRTNDVILIERFTTQLGEGQLAGRAELQGSGDSKTTAFDVNLENAALGLTIHDVVTWTAGRRGEDEPPASEFEKQMQNGKLTLALSAEGPTSDLLQLRGAGSAAITDPGLANINLLGPLSTLLKRTILNFSTLQLNQANADFTIEGEKLLFPRVKITGERGSMDASGNYSLSSKDLDFNTKVRPFEGGEGLLDAVFTPFSSVLEVKLRGKLDDPKWTFVYSPTKILRNLTGENNRNRTPAPAPPPPKEPATPTATTPQ